MANAIATSTVTVASKLPFPFILRVCDMVEREEAVMGNVPRRIKVAAPRQEEFVIEGNSWPHGMAPVSPMASGFALTPGVDKAFFDLWLDQNKTADMVKNGLLFAHSETRSVEAQARDHEAIKSGLERLDPANLPREFRKKDGSAKLKQSKV